MLLVLILGSFTVLSTALTFWQWIVGRRFPLNRRTTVPSATPAMTLLKPLKGCDAESERCLASWLDQHGSERVQILFGVSSENDPASALVRRLLAAHPGVDGELVVCPQPLGPNGKLSILAQLQPRVKHDIMVVSDDDVEAPSDLLGQLAAMLADPVVGLACCPYRLANPTGIALTWEAVALNADFWSQVLQSRSLAAQDFALGAVMAIKRSALDRIGGFRVLVDYLADDFELGHRLARAGWVIGLCPVVVDCREAKRSWPEVWRHQVRWARTIRVCRPAPYFASILANGTFWPMLLGLAGAAADNRMAWAGALTAMAVRFLAAGDLQARFAPLTRPWPRLWMVPVKDLLGVILWALAFAGNRIEWRGRHFAVGKDGRLSDDA